MEVCDNPSGSFDVVVLWSKVKVIEKNLATMEFVTKDVVIVPLGADNAKENMYNYMTPYVKDLLGKKRGDMVELVLPRAKFELEILEITNLQNL